MNKQMKEKRKLFLTGECQLIGIERIKGRKPVTGNLHSSNWFKPE